MQNGMRFHYAWVVAALTFCVLIVVAGVRSASGVLLVPLEHDMGWSAATISAAVAINVTLYGAMGPFAAALMQRIGVRGSILLALGVIALSTASAALISSPLELALTWGLGLGLGVGTVSMVLATVVATRWFVSRRGVIIGALTGGTATGQLVFLPPLAFVAQNVGWRPVGLIVAGVALVVAIPVAFLMRDQPEDVGLRPFGAAADAPLASPVSSVNPLANAFAVLWRASRRRDFWLVGGTFFVCGASTNGFIGTHFIAACGDHGIPEVQAAGYLATMGIFSFIGTTTSGWLSDQFPSRFLLCLFYGTRGLSLLILPSALADGGEYVLPAFMIFYGLDWLATVAPSVRTLTETLGKGDAPIAFGWICVFHQLGAGLIAFVAGVIRTGWGSYNPAFTFSATLCFVAAALALSIGIGRSSAEPVAPVLARA